jgi:hypothetical protein
MKKINIRHAGFALSALLAVLPGSARAGDFVEDLGKCAKAPIQAIKDASDPEKAVKVAKFVVEHGECVPKITAADPTLIVMTGAIAGFQEKGWLPKDADGCVDSSIGVGSKYVASALVNAPGVSSLLTTDASALLKDIAKGATDSTLYDVPGFSFIAQSVTCGCAVASEGIPIDELKSQITATLESVEGCSGVLANLLGGAYETSKQALAAVNDAAAKAYGSMKDTVNAIGCELGLGGCDDDPPGPPFFCVGYENIRRQGVSAEQLLASFGWMWKDTPQTSALSPFVPMTASSSGAFGADKKAQEAAADAKNKEVDGWFAACEVSYQQKIADEAKKIADAEEEKRILKELEKAEKLASSYALRFAFDWIPKCRKDSACEKGVSMIADQFGADLADPETIKKHGTFTAAAKAVYAKYSSNAGVAVALADERRKKSIRKDRNAAPADKLWAYDCKPFLGRDKQSICRDQAGFDICKAYVKQDRWGLCVKSGAQSAFFATGSLLQSSLKGAGCIAESQTRTATSWQCLSPAARDRCSDFRRGGSALSCRHETEAAQKKINEVVKAIENSRQPTTTAPTEPPPPRTAPPPRQPDPPPSRSPGS